MVAPSMLQDRTTFLLGGAHPDPHHRDRDPESCHHREADDLYGPRIPDLRLQIEEYDRMDNSTKLTTPYQLCRLREFS